MRLPLGWMILICCVLPLAAMAAVSEEPEIYQMTTGPGCLIRWDYRTDDPLLAQFSLWVRSEHGTYPKVPLKIVSGKPPLDTKIQCDTVRWGAPRVYVVQVTAVSFVGEVLQRSNELWVRWGPPDVGEPSTPIPTPVSELPTYLPPKPPPLAVRPLYPPLSPPPPGQDVWFTDSCAFKGTCR